MLYKLNYIAIISFNIQIHNSQKYIKQKNVVFSLKLLRFE